MSSSSAAVCDSVTTQSISCLLTLGEGHPVAKTGKVQIKNAKTPKRKVAKSHTKSQHTLLPFLKWSCKRGSVNFAKALVWPRSAPAYLYA